MNQRAMIAAAAASLMTLTLATAPVRSAGFFTAHLAEADPEVHAAIQDELNRQRHNIELIASENIL